jgi:hypothetical protein
MQPPMRQWYIRAQPIRGFPEFQTTT